MVSGKRHFRDDLDHAELLIESLQVHRSSLDDRLLTRLDLSARYLRRGVAAARREQHQPDAQRNARTRTANPIRFVRHGRPPFFLPAPRFLEVATYAPTEPSKSQ